MTRRRVGVRLAVPTILFSSAMAMVITGFQMASDYRQQVDDLERQLDEIQVLLPTFASSVWTFNDKQIRLGLGAVVNLPNIERATITTLAGDTSWTEGTSRATRPVARKYPLIYGPARQEQRLGSLEVVASLDSIYQRLLLRAVSLLASNTVKTFLVAGFMLLLVRRLVTRRLALLERRMAELAPQLNLPDSADIVRQPKDGEDEIDALGRGFNQMSARLSRAVHDLQAAEEELRLANIELDGRVRQRTAELVVANQSLTEAKKVAEDAAEAERQIRQEQRNFLSMVSHEFRTPLSIIGASSQVLGVVAANDDMSREELAKINRAVGRMSGLIDVCLADDRLDSGALTLRLGEVDVNALVEELCRDARVSAPGRVRAVPARVPPVVQGDAALLRIAISNLVDNALKFSPADRPVEVHVATAGAGAAIRVVDEGIGISREDRARIFEKFFRSPSADGVRGAGLGLNIARRIIDLHGGDVELDSEVGVGTTFLVRLP